MVVLIVQASKSSSNGFTLCEIKIKKKIYYCHRISEMFFQSIKSRMGESSGNKCFLIVLSLIKNAVASAPAYASAVSRRPKTTAPAYSFVTIICRCCSSK